MTESVSTTSPVAAPPRRGGAGAVWGGLTLMVLGGVFLLQSLGWLGPHFNWWALFILIPAASALWAAGAAFERGGRRFNAAARGSLGGGLIILTVALMFLLDLDWRAWWPLMLMAPGLAIFINGFSEVENVNLRALAQMNWWVGAAVIGLGLTFLLNTLHVISLPALFGRFQWWGAFILLPGLGAFVTAGLLFLQNGHRLNAAVRGLLAAGLALGAVATVALLGLDWNLLTPILLISTGVVLLIGFGKD